MKSCDFLAALIRRQPWDLDHRADFDRTHARPRNPPGNADRLVEIVSLHHEVPSKMLPRLREWTVGHHPSAVSYPDTGRRRGRLQRGGSQIMAARLEFHSQLR